MFLGTIVSLWVHRITSDNQPWAYQTKQKKISHHLWFYQFSNTIKQSKPIKLGLHPYKVHWRWSSEFSTLHSSVITHQSSSSENGTAGVRFPMLGVRFPQIFQMLVVYRLKDKCDWVWQKGTYRPCQQIVFYTKNTMLHHWHIKSQSSGLLMLAAFSEHYMGVLGSKWSFDQLVGGCVRLYSSVVLNNTLCFSFCFHSSQFWALSGS